MPVMTASTRRILKTESAISMIPNSLGGGLIAWLIFRSADPIPMWGLKGIVFDLVPTTFLLTLVTTIILTLVVRKRVRDGKAERAAPGRFALPKNIFVRGAVLGLVMMALFVPLTVLLLENLWGQGWSLNGVIIFKVIYCTLLGFAVTPLIALAALRDR
jgi:hypothetical protein